MPDAIWAGIIGFITGGIASIVAPWVNWGIEKRRQRLEYRRELVRDWRRMVVNIQAGYDPNIEQQTIYEQLEQQPEFLSLEPRLSDGEKKILKSYNWELGVVHVVKYAENVHRINPLMTLYGS